MAWMNRVGISMVDLSSLGLLAAKGFFWELSGDFERLFFVVVEFSSPIPLHCILIRLGM